MDNNALTRRTQSSWDEEESEPNVAAECAQCEYTEKKRAECLEWTNDKQEWKKKMQRRLPP